MNFKILSYTFLESAGTGEVDVVKVGETDRSFSVRVYGGDKKERGEEGRKRDGGRKGRREIGSNGWREVEETEEGKKEKGREG